MDVGNSIRLVVLAAIWGASFLFLRLSVPEFGPGLVVELRLLIAALFLWIVSTWIGGLRGLTRHWKHFLGIGLLNSALPFLLIAYAAQTLTASILSILNSFAPIFGALAGAALLQHTINRRAVTGLILGITGVAVIVWDGVAPVGEDWELAVAASITATFFYGLSGAIARKSSVGFAPLEYAHGSMWGAAAAVIPAALLWPAPQTPTVSAWSAVLALAVVCTGVAYLLYFRLIKDAGPMKALSVTFLIPVFGVLWGALFLDEPIDANLLAGGVIVLIGTGLANGLFDRILRPSNRRV